MQNVAEVTARTVSKNLLTQMEQDLQSPEVLQIVAQQGGVASIENPHVAQAILRLTANRARSVAESRGTAAQVLSPGAVPPDSQGYGAMHTDV